MFGGALSGGCHRRGRAVPRTRSVRRGIAGEKPGVKRGSALRALFVGPKGEQHAVDRAAGRLPSRAVLKSDSPPRVGVDRRSIRVAGISVCTSTAMLDAQATQGVGELSVQGENRWVLDGSTRPPLRVNGVRRSR